MIGYGDQNAFAGIRVDISWRPFDPIRLFWDPNSWGYVIMK